MKAEITCNHALVELAWINAWPLSNGSYQIDIVTKNNNALVEYARKVGVDTQVEFYIRGRGKDGKCTAVTIIAEMDNERKVFADCRVVCVSSYYGGTFLIIPKPESHGERIRLLPAADEQASE